MAITVKHSKVSTIPDDADTSLVRPSDWNADHTLVGTIDVPNGGTGATTLTGYVKGNGTAAMTASATVPSTDITGLGTMSAQNANSVNITGGSISGTTVAGYVPTTTSITAGTGLTGGGDLSANRTLAIANTAVTAAAYGSASKTLTATVNAQGQLTALADTNIAIANTQVSGLGTASTKDAGAALGVATLDAGGKVPVSELPAAVLGALSYQGTWDANTNTPTLTSSVGTKGYYYVVSVAGSTNLNGITDWVVGDWAVFNGTVWQKVDNTDSVTSVNGATGAVVLTTTNIAEGTNLYYTDVRARASNSAGTGISYDNITGVITNSAPDQTVALTDGTAIDVTGTYPNFTINNTAPDQTVVLTAGAGISTSGTYPNFTITNTSPSSGGTVTSVATGTGLTGGPITSSGTISIDSTVATLTGTQTLTNKTLTSPKVNEILDASGNEVLGLLSTASATDYLAIKNGIGVGVPLHISSEGSSANIGLHIQPKGTGLVTISDGTDFNKGIRFRSSSSAASAITLLDAVATAGRVVTLPDATTTLVGRDTPDTLTNKSISGSTNTLSNIGNASLTNSAITINGTSTSLGGSISVGTVTSVDATAGTGISVSGGPITSSGSLTITNTAPDQTVAIASGTGISVSGTYPNFTVTNTAPSSGGTVTSVTGTSPVVSSGGNTPAISLAASYGDTQNPYASKTANFVLASPDGSAGAPTFRAIAAADIPTLNQNTTGTASNVTGTVAIANGGTGEITAAAAFNALNPMTTTGDIIYEASANTAARLPIGTTGQILTVASGIPTWASAGSGTGTVTSVAATVPSFLSVSGSPITTSGTLALTYSGTALPVVNGGTGQTTYTDGQLLIGNTTGNTVTKSTLTAGPGISVTNGSGSITITNTSSYGIDYLIVAGGGGGGFDRGGGGGAGGAVSASINIISGTTLAATIGAGATANTAVGVPVAGSNSSLASFTVALGGGGGVSADTATSAAQNGGSGGGGAGITATAGGSGTSGQGFAGGTATYAPPNYGGGGGGGASAVGGNGTTTTGGNGGAGLNWLSLGTTYAGGGGAGTYAGGTAGTGGAGGGGAGGAGGTSQAGVDGTANTGGGGGGGSGNPAVKGGNGGSGVVIIRYAGSQRGTGGTVTSAGGYTYHTFTSSGTYTA